MRNIVLINKKDNVVTCLRAFVQGETLSINNKEIKLNADIPVFHKLAIADIGKSGLCYKYGEVIGCATTDIKAGDHVHMHNIESTRGRGDKKAPTSERGDKCN
ncbi:MAG: UxaA family hydrolase [Deltaproteobacteria bacterium]|jgi:altronate dehydratase small subunit|nr:UxaA family hydrolase [Deltaproteobacteria bacterium]